MLSANFHRFFKIDDSILEELTSQLKQSTSLLEEKDEQNRKLMNTMRILEEEMDFLKSENDKKTLALDLAKANLARVGPKDSSPDSSQESGQENELVEDLDDELDKMRIRNSRNYNRVNSSFNMSNVHHNIWSVEH